MGKMKTSLKELILLCFSLPSELPRMQQKIPESDRPSAECFHLVRGTRWNSLKISNQACLAFHVVTDKKDHLYLTSGKGFSPQMKHSVVQRSFREAWMLRTSSRTLLFTVSEIFYYQPFLREIL